MRLPELGAGNDDSMSEWLEGWKLKDFAQYLYCPIHRIFVDKKGVSGGQWVNGLRVKG